VVAEGALGPLVPRLDVALEHDLCGRGHLELDRLPPDELDRLAAQEAGEHQLVDVLRERRRRRVGRDRVEPERDRHLETALRGEVVHSPVLVDLPVHEGRPAVALLHPVHADVAAARTRIACDHRRQRDERRRVPRPAGLDRQDVQVDLVSG